jgi:UDP-3-O-[3-hydroxymyristoyl] glucosamine N-acyltransferase
MPDPRFFTKSPPKSLAAIIAISGAELANPSDGDSIIVDVAPLDTATASQISFLDNKKFKDKFSSTQAGACFVHPDMVQFAPPHVKLLITKSPYKAYALTAQSFYSHRPPSEISPLAHIDSSAEIDPTSTIEPFVVIGAGVKIGKNCIIRSHVSISHAIIGDNVHIYAGARIGQDGFGFAIDSSGYVKVPQLGRVIIEGHTEIGANATIDRGAMSDTIIGMGTWIDNLVQIGHNVHIGKGCVIVSQVGIAGSTTVGDYTLIGGQAGIAGHLKIGSMVKIAAKSGVTRDIPDGEEWMGYPAQPMKQFLRQVAYLNKSIKRG